MITEMKATRKTTLSLKEKCPLEGTRVHRIKFGSYRGKNWFSYTLNLEKSVLIKRLQRPLAFYKRTGINLVPGRNKSQTP